MIVLEKLTTGNIEKFKKIYSKSLLIESYDKKFFEQYNKQNFLLKYLYRKSLYIIKVHNKIIGFIWCDSSINPVIIIWSLFIEYEYIDKININTLSNFNGKTLYYEAIDNNRNNLILERLGFRKNTLTTLMELNLNKYIKEDNYLKLMSQAKTNSRIRFILKKQFNIEDENIIIEFKKFDIEKDTILRCTIQNEIFSNSERIPISTDDIISDTKQDYFIPDLCYFIKINKLPIGYGQIVYNRGMHTLVNFGILYEFRNNNLGKIFLNKLIQLTKKKGIENLYIRVEEGNFYAKKLYEWCGFQDKYPITKWERK